MTVVRASVLGRCMGVKRAIAMAEEEAEKVSPSPSRKVFTLGPLIHNPQAVAELEGRGIHALEESELDGRVAGASVVIRAHGVPPRVKEQIQSLGAKVTDATCPRVIASQRKVAKFVAEGYFVVIAGEAGHGEVVGLAGHALRPDGSQASAVVGSPEEARALRLPDAFKLPNKEDLPSADTAGKGGLALIAQSTIKREEYQAIREALMESHPSLVTVDSICACTDERQEALLKLAQSVDAILVIGGRNSANTTRLYQSAAALKPAWLIETAGEIPEEAYRFARLGLTAGASTPDRLIDEVEETLLHRGDAQGKS